MASKIKKTSKKPENEDMIPVSVKIDIALNTLLGPLGLLIEKYQQCNSHCFNDAFDPTLLVKTNEQDKETLRTYYFYQELTGLKNELATLVTEQVQQGKSIDDIKTMHIHTVITETEKMLIALKQHQFTPKKKLKAIATFETATASSKLNQRLIGLTVGVIVAGVGLALGTAIGAGIGFAVGLGMGLWTGPGAMVTALAGAYAGACVTTTAIATLLIPTIPAFLLSGLGLGAGLGLGTWLGTRQSPLEKRIDATAHSARKYIALTQEISAQNQSFESVTVSTAA